jgi:regulator of nucleoside diphosphate kinase
MAPMDPAAREQLRLARQLVDGSVAPDRATIDARIEFEDESSGERRVILLVHPRAANERLGRVSVLEPLGMALLGLREGECVDWPLENGARRRIRLIRVVAVPGGRAGNA